MTTTTNILNTRELRTLVYDIAADYAKESHNLPIDYAAANLIEAAPELLDMVRELREELARRIQHHPNSANMLERARILLDRCDA
jgi:predicted Zn-dependent peptidase